MLVKTIAKMLGVPFYIGSATSITASGYVGDDVESLLSGLLMNCDYDVEKAKTGIVFIDEVDKIAKREAGVSVTRDVSGECVQQGLLKMVEGHRMGVQPQGGRKHPEQPLIYLDTTDILFIGSGAFVGLDGIVERRTGRDKNRIGFGNAAAAQDGSNPYADVTAQDLREFGLIPEFVGRFPVVTYVDPLDSAALENILTKPKNNLVSQYTELFREDGITLTFEPGAISAAAQRATDLGTGARGLRSIMEKAMRDLMFAAPKAAFMNGEREIVVTREMILGASPDGPARAI
jgi:ATP-dependent Clp protease ATP-binding subunit ClpX